MAPELSRATERLGWRRPTDLPGRPKTNDIAGRSVRQVLSGTRSVLEASGPPRCWWSRVARRYCLTRKASGNAWKREPNVCELRHGAPFSGKLVLLGARIDYRPSLPSQRTGDPFDSAALPGFLVGYHINPWGRWIGDYYRWDSKVIEENHDARYL